MPKSVVMVIAPEMFRDEEYAEPKQVLEGAGFSVTTASTRPGECVGKLGMRAIAEISVREARQRPWDAVVFVGGAGAAVYFDDPDAHSLARAGVDAGAIVSAICIAPSVLGHAGLLQGRRATAFESQEDDLVARGALWVEAPVAVDGRLITANGPAAATQFGEAIAAMLTELDGASS